MGSSIVNMFYNSTTGVSDYCCGTPIGTGNGQGVQCQHNEPSFTLPQANILPGYGALKGYTCTTSNSTDNSTTTCSNSSTSAAAPTSSSSHDVALGAGLGVPLGVIALGSLLWGFYERRRASRLSRALTQNGVPAQGLLATPQTPQSRSVNKSSAPTELDSRRRYAELQGSH